MASLKRYKFSLNTSSFCFLCLEKLPNNHENLCAIDSSLNNILRYLNVNLCEIKTLSTKPVSLLSKTDIRVSLCNSCEKSNEEISNLYGTMEIIRMKLDYSFELIHKRMESFKERRNEKMQNSEAASLRHSNLVKELRQEIRKKFDLKMPNYHPRVALEKRSDSVLRKASSMMQYKDMKISSQIETSPVNFRMQFESETPEESSPVLDIGETNCVSTLQQSLKEEPEDVSNCDFDGVWDREEISTDSDFNSEPEVGSSTIKKEVAGLNPSSRRTHWNTEKEKRMKRFRKSGPIFKSRKYLDMHYRKDAATGLFQCTECNKSFTSRNTVYIHYNAIHLHKRQKCQSCNKLFKYANDLRKHRQKCQQNLKQCLAKEKDPKFKFVCEVCGKRWDTPRGLVCHRRNVHRNVGRYACDLCDKKFTSFASLRRHKDAIHFGKTFSCKFCNKIFGVSNKSRHEKICRHKHSKS